MTTQIAPSETALRRPAPSRLPARVADEPLERVNAPQGFWRGFGPTAREVWNYRELLSNLVRKEVKVRYKDSVLGFVWTLILPLVQLAVYWLVMGQFLNGGSVPYYGIFIFAGLAVWTLFSEILTASTTSVVNNSGLVKKVYFPRELFPLAATGAALFNFVFQLIILILATILAGVTSGQWPDLAMLPMPILALAALTIFATALGLLLAAANVYLRDIQHLITVVVMMWFWITPIVYGVSRVSGRLPRPLYDVFLLNPMATVVFAFHKFFWPQGPRSRSAPTTPLPAPTTRLPAPPSAPTTPSSAS